MHPRVLILGGGFSDVAAARELERARGDLDVMLVSREVKYSLSDFQRDDVSIRLDQLDTTLDTILDIRLRPGNQETRDAILYSPLDILSQDKFPEIAYHGLRSMAILTHSCTLSFCIFTAKDMRGRPYSATASRRGAIWECHSTIRRRSQSGSITAPSWVR